MSVRVMVRMNCGGVKFHRFNIYNILKSILQAARAKFYVKICLLKRWKT